MILNSKFKQFNSTLYANYLLIGYAFFLPISPKISSILMIFIALFTLLSEDLKERFLYAIKDKIVIAFIAFYVMHILWIFGSEHLHVALLKVKDLRYLLYILIIMMVLKKEFVTKILTAFLLAMLFSESMSYCMYFNIHLPFIHLSQNSGTNVPFMLSYTQYATILSISMGLILYALNNKNMNIYFKIFYITFFISASVNIFIIGSRIGYVLYLISIATVLFYIYRNNLIKASFLSLLLISIGYTAAFKYGEIFSKRSEQIVDDFHLIFDNDLSTSLGVRAGYYLYGLQVVKDSPIFGVGTGDHIAATEEKILATEINSQNLDGLRYALKSGHNASLHSEYLDTMTQFGIIGLLVFLNIFYQTIKYQQREPNLRVIQLILFSCMLFLSIGSTIFITRDVGTIFVLLIALTLNLNTPKSDSSQS